MVKVSCIVDTGAQLGESTLWDAQAARLWWIDIVGRRIHCTDPLTGRTDSWETPGRPGCIGLRAKGGLVMSMESGFAFFDTATGGVTPIAEPEAHLPDTRFNDGKTDRQGRFWSGSMFEAPGKPVQFIGALYRLDSDLSLHRVLEGIGCSNGLAWSPDSRIMYYADSRRPVVRAYDFDAASGEVANERTFIAFPETDGIADGATVDAEGCYWLARVFMACIDRYDPDGVLMQRIPMPGHFPTCVEFGGPDLDTLFVTTAPVLNPAKPRPENAGPGGLFALQPGVRGLLLPPFAG